MLLAPNEWLHPSFGKYLFAAADILAGVLMYQLLTLAILPKPSELQADRSSEKEGELNKQGYGWSMESYATLLVASHLLSPLVFTISTRGSSESVLSLFVLSTLYCALKGKWDTAATLLGLSTHWKIYPFIYGVACIGVIGRNTDHASRKGWLKALVNVRTLRFTAISLITFLGLGALMYAV